MNEILFAGDKLYKYAKKNAKTYHDYLEPRDLPSYFSLDNQHYPWKVKKKKKKKKTFSGNLNILSLVEYPFLDLETGLAMTFSFNPYAVFICNGFSIALLEQGDCFYLFDGMPNVNGKNILLKKTNITGIFLTFA